MTATTASEGLASNARVMVVGTALSRITGYLRYLALAYALGFNRLGDAYNLANTTPNIVYDLVLGGVLAGTLVPVFVTAVGRGPGTEEDWDSVSAVFTTATAVLVVLTAAFAAAVPLLIRLYTVGAHQAGTAAERRLAIDLLYLFVPQLAFYGFITLMTAVLNARRRFAAPAFTPVLNNLIVVGVILSVPHILHSRHPSIAAVIHSGEARAVLGLGTTVGVALMAIAMIPSVRAVARLRWYWNPRHAAVRTVVRLSGWTAGFVAANQVALFIVTVLANHRAGDLSAYQAAYIFFLLPHGVFAVSVMSVVEPEVADCWAARDIAGSRRHVLDGIKLTAAIVIPAGLGYAVLARPLVRLLLEHGALTASSARTTADVLALMALGLPGFSAYLLLMRVYQAMQDTKTMFLTYLVENGLNVILAFALYPHWGVRGLAASLSLAYAGGTIVALVDLRRRLGGLHGGRLGIKVYRMAVAAALSADAALAISVLLGHAWGTARTTLLLLRVLVAVATGVTVYWHVARYFGIDEVGLLLHPLKRPRGVS